MPAGSIVLDLGCGSGASAILAASIVGPPGRVIAVNLAEHLLALARDKAERSGLRNVEFRHGRPVEIEVQIRIVSGQR